MGVTSLGPHLRPACNQASCGSIKLCQQCGSNSCVCVFFTPWGHVGLHAQIWALWRHISHVGSMLDSDWLIPNFLRSDWLGPPVAWLTTEAPIHTFNMCCLRIFCFVWPISTTDTCYLLELGTEMIQFEDQVRFCGAQRRKFVKNQIKPKWRTSFEVSKWALLKEFFRLVLTEI